MSLDFGPPGFPRRLKFNLSMEKTMDTANSVVAIYETHQQAECAIKELQEAGVDMNSLSIAARDTHTDEHVVGYYNAGDRMKHGVKWERSGADSGAFYSDRGCSSYPG
jgi:hypothetical protein